MKNIQKYRKVLIALLVAIPVTAYGATYTLTTTDITLNVNGTQVSCMPLILNGSTYLPLRTVAETVGAQVNYTNSTRKIDINTLDTAELAKSCVMLQVSGGQGSGVYIDYGEILTCDHVTRNMTSYKTSDGLKLSYGKGNQTLDAGTLTTTNTSVKPVKIGDSDELKINDKVVFITSPGGNKNTVTYGTILEDCTPGKTILKVWADIYSGSSGGAVFNMKGELVGIIARGPDTATTTDKRAAMIPINEIRKQL